MFDANKILGGFLKESLGDTGSLSGKAGLAMGLLGVAMAAAEHFMERKDVPFSEKGNMSSVPTPPPPPPKGNDVRHSPPPPPPPPMSNFKTDINERERAILLIQAMIAAANADGFIDPEEKRRILAKFSELNLSQEEREFLERELSNPRTIDYLVFRSKGNKRLSREIFIVSLLAIDIDTQKEHDYINELSKRLGIDEETKRQIFEQLGIKKI